MELRTDKLDMAGRARATALEGECSEDLAWHAACLEAEVEELKATRQDLQELLANHMKLVDEVERLRDALKEIATSGDVLAKKMRALEALEPAESGEEKRPPALSPEERERRRGTPISERLGGEGE